MWTARPTAFQPDTHRCWFGQTYDEKNEVVLLFGGRSCLGDTYFNDTWAYGPDPDGDGIVGGLDNCQTVSNDDQANLDNDVAGDACDCASGDPGAFAVPAEVTDLTVDGDDVIWNEQASSAGDDTVYDLVTGDLSVLLNTGDLSTSQCLANDLSAPTYQDLRTPVSGDGFYYVARSVNVCGVGTYGRLDLDSAMVCP